MNPLQTEPFATGEGPFATNEPASGGISVRDTGIEAFAPNGNGPNVIADSKHAGLFQITVYMPPELNVRLRKQVAYERRILRVVMDRVVEEFLENTSNEPRPYIPTKYADGRMSYQFRISPEAGSFVAKGPSPVAKGSLSKEVIRPPFPMPFRRDFRPFPKRTLSNHPPST